MINITKRSAIVALWISTTESQIMVLDISCSSDSLSEVGIISLVIIFQSQLLSSRNIFSSIEHLHTFIHSFDAIATLIRDLKSLTCTLFGFHLNNTRSTARTIKCSFAGIFQNRKTFYIRRINCCKCSHIRGYAINNNKWFVTSHNGSSTSNTNSVQHGDTVKSIGCDIDTGCLSTQCIEGIVKYAFLQEFRFHHAHRSRQA